MSSDPALDQVRSSYGGPRAKILVVDDEQSIRRAICVGLTARGYTTLEASTGGEVLEAAAHGMPSDVILLDLGLPDLDGIEVTRRLRRSTQAPIIILSVRDSQSDKIAALDAGADDYLTKPCGSTRLLERIKATLLRPTLNEKCCFESGGLRVDLTCNAVHVGGRAVELTPNEYKLLRILTVNTGRLLTHQRIIREVWGQAPTEDALRRLRITISSLREKLEADPMQPRYIGTESGVGYRLWTGPWTG
jgi:two-component system, OmpR family, KDP operon response regulator KdpE